MKYQQWNKIITSLRYPHILQSYQWGEFKSGFGWKPRYKVWEENSHPVAAAMILERQISLKGFASPIKILYIPKGPLLLDWDDTALRHRVLHELIAIARQRNAIFIKIDPDVQLGIAPAQFTDQYLETQPGNTIIKDLQNFGWIYSNEQVQFRNTIQLDLSRSEEELLRDMKQKTRYNIRLAQKKDVIVRIASHEDIPLLYKMYAETARRDQFIIREEKYYQNIWEMLFPTTVSCSVDRQNMNSENNGYTQHFYDPIAVAYIAEVEEEPIAAVIYYYFADKAWYFFGMSRDSHREKMPNHLLQWIAIRNAKKNGIKIMDFWGAPEISNEQDPLWGVLRFKAGFGGSYIRHIGAWDYPVRPLFYKFYTEIIPRFMDIMRKCNKNQMFNISG